MNNEFCLNYDGWRTELFVKVKFPFNLEKAAEFLTLESSWRKRNPHVLFYAEPSNITDLKRFLRTSSALRSIHLSANFEKSFLTEQKCAEWFRGPEKLTRYLRININSMLSDRNERLNMLRDINKTKDCSKLIDVIKQKGININGLSMTGPRVKKFEKSIKFSIDEDLKKLVELDSENVDISRLVSKFIFGSPYAFRFIDYDA